jgi:hypothetical protein
MVLATFGRSLRKAGSAQLTLDEHAGSEVTASGSVSDRVTAGLKYDGEICYLQHKKLKKKKQKEIS